MDKPKTGLGLSRNAMLKNKLTAGQNRKTNSWFHGSIRHSSLDMGSDEDNKKSIEAEK